MKVSVLGRIALSLFALLPLMAGVSEAQDAAPASRVAFVNMRQVMDSTPGYSAAESTFVQEMTAWRGEFQQLQNRLDSAATAFEQQSTMLSPSAREARRNELQAQQDTLQTRLTQLNQRAAERERELLDPIQARAVSVVEAQRVAGGYSMVFDISSQASSIITADRSLDLTARVIAALKSSGGS
jgi:Skp family chaperone for outer membrane proteins